MKRPIQIRPYLGYLASIAISLLMVCIQIPFRNQIVDTPFLLFYPTIFLCAWIGGFRTGLIATFINILGLFFLLNSTFNSLIFQILFSSTMGFIISFLLENYRENFFRLEIQSVERELALDILEHGDPIYALDSNYRFILVNKKQEDISKKKRNELLNRIIWDVFPDLNEGNIKFRQILENVMQTKESHVFENYYLPLDLWAEVVVYPTRPGGVAVLYRDISERKKAEAHIAQLSEQRQLALDAALMGWWIYDPISTVATYDKRYTEIFGVSGMEKPNDEILKLIHPDDLPFVWKAVEDALNPHDPKPYSAEYRIFDGKGGVKWIEANGVAHFEGEGTQRFAKSLIGTVVDITKRKQSEEAVERERELLTRLIERLPIMITIYDPKLNTFRFNNEFRKVLGWSVEEAKNGNLMNLAYPDPAERLQAVQHMNSINPDWHEFNVKSKDGQLIPSSWANLKLSDETNVGIGIDLRELKETTKKLQDAVLARDDFFSITSHELKTPLTSLKLLSQITQRRMVKDNHEVYKEEYVNKLVEQTDLHVNRLTRLVDDMLDVGRISTGNLKMEPTKLDLNVLVSEVIERMRPNMMKENTPPVYECNEKIEGYWDQGRIEQVIINLLTNAMKYGEHKTVTIRLEKKGDHALLSISDQGIGVLVENKIRIFNRFERAISANEVSGLGLGLFISEQIVKAHHGKVWVESPGSNCGSTFFVELPVNPQVAI